jgi:two-component system sensor kinase FixL
LSPIKLERIPCDLARVWREAWSHLAAGRQEKQAALVEATDGTDLRCVADPFRLEQVFRNILDNALAAGSPPVAVEVHAESVHLQDQPAIRITFRDNGPGIPPDRRDRVFDPFFTTKARGTGLGMPIARRIVEAHGGRIGVGDGDAPGASFCITLPRGSP